MQTKVRDYSFDQLQTIKGFFTEDEWETISVALEDYINYDDDSTPTDELIGGYDEKKGKKFKIEGFLEEFALTKSESDELIMNARNNVFK